MQRFTILLLLAAILLGFNVVQAAPDASATSFHFVFSADSRGDYTVLPDFSNKMLTLDPVFGFFAGDLCSTFDTTCINNQWKPAMDGNNNNGMLARTFVSRGNHDSGTLSSWQGLWDFQGMAGSVGAVNYTAQAADATYSFDYGNSHFVVIDSPGGGSNTWTSSQISWLDADLSAAESRGVVHEFLMSHGPIYTVTSAHGSEVPSAELKAVLNKHPISAGFHGHEHITAYTHVTTSVVSGVDNYQQFTLGRAGAPAYSISKPVDWSASQNAFGDIAVNGNDFTVTIYSQGGTALWSKTFTDAGTTPTPTPSPTATPSAAVSSVTYRSNATYDGHILESSETSGLGGSFNSTNTSFRLGDDASDRQYRAILSFNTSGLPDNAVITSVTLKIKKAGSAGTDPYTSLGNILADVKTGSFSGSAYLQAGDFSAGATKNAVLSIPNTPVDNWYSKSMSSTYFGYVSKTGTTQFRLRFSTDDNDNGAANYLAFFSGNYTTTNSYRPALVVQYYVP